MVRMSAEERRASVVRAAVTEFARGGYHGTSTEVIARRVGVSQPYLFRLFPGKQAIFLAAVEACQEKIVRTFAEAAEGVPTEGRKVAMGVAYEHLIARDKETLLMLLQMCVAVASAEAAGDMEFGRPIRERWEQIHDHAHLALGGDAEATARFMGHGMLINSLVSLGFPAEHRVWDGLPSEQD
ncbi:TetR/AcrR family transcriptional regulator [Streptomyces sp. I05A-00742]|uniref:TetR/AcrR family transcriptional regulator n=1 Tax=Streptomyces sp. I05A-00742 TaxID=2732853 RepID=UPI001489A828|nr:TetR/AcrR family transcriptional regulator [Streptomyces sp. I05A-00742]